MMLDKFADSSGFSKHILSALGHLAIVRGGDVAYDV